MAGAGVPTSGSYLKLLGSPAACLAGTPVHFPDKAYALFAVLALSPDYSVSRTRLRSMLWSESDPSHASASLRQLLTRIGRLQVEHGVRLIETSPLDVSLDPGMPDIDLIGWTEASIATLLREGGAALAQSLQTFRGELLETSEPGTSLLEDWLGAERARLRSALQRLAAAVLDDPARLSDDDLSTAAQVLRIDPTHEAAHRARIRILGVRGDLSGCRRAYLDCERALADELGVPPSRSTTDLMEGFCGGAARPGGSAPPDPDPRAGQPDPGAARDRRAPPGEPQSLRGRGLAGEPPRIALLPPLDVSGDPAAQRTALCWVEELAVGLSRYRSFRVIALHSSLAFGRGEQTEHLQWCDYALASSLRPDDGGRRVILSLSDTRTFEVVWSTDFHCPVDDLVLLFNGFAQRTVFRLAHAVERAEMQAPLAAEDATAYRLFLEGVSTARAVDLPGLRKARRWFIEAARREPDFAPAYAGIARTKSLEWLVRGGSGEAMLVEALELGARAAVLDPQDGRGHREQGFANLYLKRHEESLACFSEAVLRNANDADLLIDHADALAHSGYPEQGLQQYRRALDLNPAPPAFYRWIGGSIHYQLGQYQDALAVLDPVKDLPATARILAACAAQAGDLPAAHRHARTVRESYPAFKADQVLDFVPNKRTVDSEHLIEGLRLAGLG